MRVLLASFPIPGLLAPMVSIAHALQDEGHDVAFVTDASATDTLERAGLRRIPLGNSDGPSFQIESWGSEINVALQVKHLQYALGHYPADAICASHLALGPLIVRELTNIPVAVLGSLVLLWDPAIHIDTMPVSSTDSWRHDEQLRTLERTRALLRLPARPATSESPLLGDAFFLQGVPSLQARAHELPEKIRFVGSCISQSMTQRELLPPERAWIASQRAQGRRILFVQIGRTFGTGGWLQRLPAILRGKPIACVISKGRFEEDVAVEEEHVLLLREGVSHDEALALCDAAIVSGQPTAVLAAISHGKALVVVASGSGSEDISRALRERGCAVALEADCDDRAFEQAIDRALNDAAMKERTRALATEFASYSGARAVARALNRYCDALSPS